MISLYFILYFLISSFISDNSAQLLKELAVTGKNSEEIILNAEDITLSKEGLVYLTDKNSYKINIYNSDLKLLTSFGKRGKSLGEFKGPSQIAVCNDYIAVSDFISSRVQIFNKKFKPLHIFFAEGPILDLAFDNNGTLIIGAYTGQKDRCLFNYKIDGELISVIKLKKTKGDPFMDIFKFTITRDGYIAIVYLVQNIIEVLDQKHKFVRNIIIDKLPSKPKYKRLNDNFSFPIDNLVQSIASDSKSRIYILANLVTKPKKEVFIYSLDGIYNGSLNLLSETYELFLKNDSYLYAIEDNRTTLKKYQLKINK
ncbi:MAG: hypothetical protein Fur0015_01770 [Ignavibacteriales bacterium]